MISFKPFITQLNRPEDEVTAFYIYTSSIYDQEQKHMLGVVLKYPAHWEASSYREDEPDIMATGTTRKRAVMNMLGKMVPR